MAKFQHHTIDVETASLPVATQVTCLGVVFDCELTFSKHVSSVDRRCFYHKRQIRAVRKSLTTESVKTQSRQLHALIASRLDYCKVFSISSVQLILSTSSAVSVERRCTCHHAKAEIRPHHINITRRFTLAAYSSANNVQAEHHYLQVYSWGSSRYLTNLCVPVATNTSRRYLRSATHGDLLVPRTRTVTYGPQSFAVLGPTLWNTLPSTLYRPLCSDSFRVD